MARDLYLRAPHGDFELANDGKDGKLRVYRKELAYPGRFVKMKDGTDEPEFELPVDENLIDNWVATFQKMKANGIPVPMPLGHTTNPERRRGEVVDLKKEPNPERGGAPSLYAYCKFSDPEAERTLRHSDVSLFMPPDFHDGKGNKYIRPIRHVAITDYPVIPGLDRFQPVAASFELSLDTEEHEMSWTEVAEELGIELPEGADDEAAHQAVLEAWKAGEEPDGDEGSEGSESEDDFEQEGEGASSEDEGVEVGDTGFEQDVADDTEEEEGEMTSTKGAPPAMSQAPIAASLVRREARNRASELDRLVNDRRISRPVADKFKSMFCTEQYVGYALSLETMGEESDVFEDVVAALSLLPTHSAMKAGEFTGRQDQPSRPNKKSPLVADAEKRSVR